jgi:uncharacterized GH25 family protein
MRAPLAAAALLAVPLLARAHDLWLEPGADGYVLRSGHRGHETLPIDAARVKAIRCLEAGASAPRDVRAGAVFAPAEVRVPARCAVVSAASDLGFFVLTPDGEKNVPRTQAPNAVKSWASRQYAKWVDARSPAAGTPVGDELELVPATALGKLKVGDKYAVRVLLDGKPVAGAVVAAGHHALGETDREGILRIRVHERGVQSIDASLRRPLRAPEADTLVLEASLTFQVER